MELNLVYEIQPGPYWDWKVAADLFFGGAGIGALLFAVLMDAFFKGRYQRICRTAAWLSPLLVVLGLVFLLLKLGRPQLLLLTFVHFAPTSPLWWGGIFQVVLVLGGIVYALVWRRRIADAPGRRMLGWILAPIAVIVGAYHGLLLAVMTSRPLWNTGPTVIAAILGFMATGIAAVMLTHMVRMKVAGRLVEGEQLNNFLDDMKPVRNVLVATLLLQLGTFFLWWLSLRYGTLQDTQALAAANASYGGMFWYLGIGLGLVFPLFLGAIAVWRGEAADRTLQLHAVAWTSAFILIGGFFFRLALVLSGQEILPIPPL